MHRDYRPGWYHDKPPGEDRAIDQAIAAQQRRDELDAHASKPLDWTPPPTPTEESSHDHTVRP